MKAVTKKVVTFCINFKHKNNLRFTAHTNDMRHQFERNSKNKKKCKATALKGRKKKNLKHRLKAVII